MTPRIAPAHNTLISAAAAGSAETPLSGGFVSLKRAKHLRACCGGLQGQAMTLGRAVYDAAVRSTLERLVHETCWPAGPRETRTQVPDAAGT